ncbi:MAG TPA: O-antigen ligase family protein [Candidatus Acidoferrales bacterium]|nr:O-antigen ligase family protein [Candidatus Acidoferrales bacterium]
MPFHAVVDRVEIIPPLDPAWLIVFIIIFATCALAAARRPALGIAALILLTPFAAEHSILGTTISAPKVALLGAIVGISSVPSRWAVLIRRPAAGIAVAFCILVAANALTLAGATHRAEVLREALKWTEYLLYFCTVYAAYVAQPSSRILRTAFFLTIFLVTAGALSEILTGASWGIWVGGKPLPRIAGVLEGPNQFGGYLETAIAALGAWQIRKPDRITSILLLVSGAALVLSFSRAAILCAVIIVAVFALIERKAVTRLWPLALGVAAGWAEVLFWIQQARVQPSLIFDRATDYQAGEANGLGNRSELWHAALYFFRTHPLLGIGAGNFPLELPLAGLYGVRTLANDWYLEAAADGGIVLLSATLAWLVTVARTLLRVSARSPWAVAATAATCAFAAHGFFDDLAFYPKVAEPWIALIALGIAAPPERE